MEPEDRQMVSASLIYIQGIVQGVGFRPFIYRLAQRFHVSGYVINTSKGVEIAAEGTPEQLEAFAAAIPQQAPALAIIERMQVDQNLPLQHLQGFEIRASQSAARREALILPDIAICPDCRAELRNPADRRYHYPFINCTNCGPRFTIIENIPYDRASTTMKQFCMCPACAGEFTDVRSRRFHAQPDCCETCGPEIFWQKDAHPTHQKETADQVIAHAVECILSGGIAAIKSIGGIHLACDAADPAVVTRLRQRKHRDERPLAIMCPDINAVRQICDVSVEEEKLLTSPRAPIVLLRKKARAAYSWVSQNAELGVMLPYTPLHELLFEKLPIPLVMTSGNLSEQPVIYRNEDALERLRDVADGFLLHNREIRSFCDDSLLRVLDGKEYFLRRSRGYVPQPVLLGDAPAEILACGAEQKASFSLSKGFHLFQSQHIGNLKNVETLMRYEDQIQNFRTLFDITPRAVACDLHPDYLSTEVAERFAAQNSVPLIRVQHHHAHMASCMLDNGLTGQVIGLVWDGTGYGTDGTIWGGECLAGDFESVRRCCTIRSVSLIGGDRAVKEISRIAFSMLSDAGENTEKIPNAGMLSAVYASGIGCIPSSGMGRLFDGVAAIIGLRDVVSYEGQGAVLLENAACETARAYPLESEQRNALQVFDWRPMVRGIVRDLAQRVPAEEIAGAFMNTLVTMAVQMCTCAKEQTGLRDVVLSGGTFQNMFLMHRLPGALQAAGFRVHHHHRFSTNDEGISAGQLAVANARLNGREAEVSRAPAR